MRIQIRILNDDDTVFTEFDDWSFYNAEKHLTNAKIQWDRIHPETITNEQLEVFMKCIEPQERILK